MPSSPKILKLTAVEALKYWVSNYGNTADARARDILFISAFSGVRSLLPAQDLPRKKIPNVPVVPKVGQSRYDISTLRVAPHFQTLLNLACDCPQSKAS